MKNGAQQNSPRFLSQSPAERTDDRSRPNSQRKNLRFGLTAGSVSWFESSLVSRRAIPFSESQLISIPGRT